MIETDVHLSKDGVAVLMHDHTVDRTTDATGLVADMTVDEIRLLNAGDKENPEQVPLFEEFLSYAAENGIIVNIEIKEYYSTENETRCIKCIEDILSLVEKYNMAENIIINSFDAWILEYTYKKYGKKYKLHGFYPYNAMSNVAINPDKYLYCACVYEDQNKDNYDYLIKRNIEPWIGAGVTQQSRLAICLKYGAKLITTNNPLDIVNKLERIKNNG